MRRWVALFLIALLAAAGCSLQSPAPPSGPGGSLPPDDSAPPAWVPPVPTVSGTAKVGQTLTADAGDWGAKVTYQWYSGNAAIKKATKTTYVPGAADYGKTLFVRVTGPDLTGAPVTADSAPTAKIGQLVVNDEMLGHIGRTFAQLSSETTAGIADSGTYGGISRWHDSENVRVIYEFDAPAKTDPKTPFRPKDADPCIAVYAPASTVFTGFPGEMPLADFLKVSGASGANTRRTATLGRITTFKLAGRTWMVGAVAKVSKDTPFTVGTLKIH